MSISEFAALPERPHLEHLKRQARELLSLARRGDPAALAKLSPVLRGDAAADVNAQTAKLADAQHVIAKSYGHASWPALKAEVRRRRAQQLEREGLPNEPEQRMELVLAAIDDNDPQALDVLLELDRSLAEGWGQRRPLQHAAERDRPELIDLLLNAGASFQPEHGWPHDPLSWAITTRSLRAAKRLAERGAPLDLWCAAGLGEVERLPGFFGATGRPIPNASRHGATRYDENGQPLPKPPTDPVELVSDALYIASRNGQLDAARFLLEHGADPSFEGFAGAPALHWAAFSGNQALVRLLLERGADPQQREQSYRCTYRPFAVRTPIEWSWLSALERALAGDASLANERDSDWGPPLHAAAAKGLDEHVQVLLAAGADPSARDHAGRSAFERASEAQDSDAAARIAAMLRAAGAS